MTTSPRRSSRLADKAAERAFVAPAERPRPARVPRSAPSPPTATSPLKDPIDEYLLLTFGSTKLRRRRFSHDWPAAAADTLACSKDESD